MSERGEVSYKSLIWITLGVLVVWVGSGALVTIVIPNMASRGQFGDMYGSINALFSGLAFAGVIFTIHLQRIELALQRKELQLTRRELMRSASAQEASERSLRKQADALEHAAMLNALNSIIDHYDKKISRVHNAVQKGRLFDRQRQYIDQLEGFLAEFNAEK